MKAKRYIAFVMTVITVTSMLIIPFSIKASAIGGVQAKLGEVMKEFPPVTSADDKNAVYFTVSGNPSTSVSSDDCFYPDVARAHGYNWDNMWNAYSCCGFVHFVFRYIFGVEFTWQESVTSTVFTIDKTKTENDRITELDAFFKTCKVGDAVLFRRPSTHYIIFLGYDEETQRVSTYDCGWDQECAVKTLNRPLSTIKDYESVTVYHANNYNRIDAQYGVEPVFEYNILSSNDKTVEITGCSEDAQIITVPSELDGYTIVRIAKNAFANTSLESISLPDTLTSIGKNAFENTPLFYNSMVNDSVYIGNSLIYAGGFEEEFTVKYGTVIIADYAFDSEYINTVIISEGTEYISETAFDNSNVSTIKGYSGTKAEEYANNYGFEFILLDENDNPFSLKLGDINGDGKISVTDAKWILQSVSGARELDKMQQAAADVNKDSKISVVDAKWILQSVAGSREI